MTFLLVSDLFEALSELIILTASSCLHGKEIRSMLDERVAQLYADLDGGFSHAAWLLPGWLPLPSFRWGCWRSSRQAHGTRVILKAVFRLPHKTKTKKLLANPD